MLTQGFALGYSRGVPPGLLLRAVRDYCRCRSESRTCCRSGRISRRPPGLLRARVCSVLFFSELH
jgi:hypothetical protein